MNIEAEEEIRKYYDLIRKIEEIEENFINNAIVLNTQEDWLRFKEKINFLDNEYKLIGIQSMIQVKAEVAFPDGKSLAHKEGILQLLVRIIEAIEKKWGNTLGENNLPFIKEQMRILMEFENIGYSMCEIEEQTEYNKGWFKEKGLKTETTILEDSMGNTFEVQTVLVGNNGQKRKHFLLEEFEQLVKRQENLYPDYQMANLFLFGKLKGETAYKISFINDFQQLVLNLESAFLNNKINLCTLEKWQEWKLRIFALLDAFHTLDSHFKLAIEDITINKKRCVRFLEIVSSCISNVEKKYQGSITNKDLDIIIEAIRKICSYSRVLGFMEEIIYESIFSLEDYVHIQDLTDREYYKINKIKKEEFEQLVLQRKELFEGYQEADYFIFGKEEKRIRN